jgi:hypothetical protein
MRQDVYAKLPEEARDLVDRIEARTRIEIEVKSKSERSLNETISEALGENVVGAIVGPRSIVIEAPTQIDAITTVDYIHELLHLERIFIDRVPQIYPRKVADSDVSANIENWLEHIIIYRKQFAMCPGEQENADTSLVVFWESCPWGFSGGFNFSFNLLSRYMFTHLFGLTASKKAMSRSIQRLNLPFSIRNIGRGCLAVSDQKPHFVASTLKFLQVPKNRFWLRRYNLETQSFDWGPI